MSLAETAVAEVTETPAETETPSIAVTEAPASPEPVEQAGDQPAPEAGTAEVDPKEAVRDALKAAGVEPKDLAAALLDVVDDTDIADHPKIAELQRSAEQRALTQQKEADSAIADREEAFTLLEAQGHRAAQHVMQTKERFQSLLASDPDEALKVVNQRNPQTGELTLVDAMNDAIQGALGVAAKAQMKVPDGLWEKHAEQIGDLSDAEKAQRKQARYKDAKEGGSRHSVELFADLLASRVAANTKAVVEPKAEANGAKKSADTAASIESLLKIAEALGGKVPPRINGKSAEPVLDTSDEARKQRIAWGGTNGVPRATDEDRAWQAAQRRRAGV